MPIFKVKFFVSAAAGTMMAIFAIPAEAVPSSGLNLDAGSIVELTRGGPPHRGRPPHRGGGRSVHHHHHHRYRYRSNGAAVGLGIFGGMVAGAALSNAANQNTPPPPQYIRSDAFSRCAAEFRSFNPSTGTIRTYDGVVRACPHLR